MLLPVAVIVVVFGCLLGAIALLALELLGLPSTSDAGDLCSPASES